MSLFHDRSDYDTESVSETLSHSSTPKITQTSIYSMEPEGLYGTVYEDPRGTNIIKMAIIIAMTAGIIATIFVGVRIYDAIAVSRATPDAVKDLSTQALDIPVLADYLSLDDAAIYTTLTQTYTVYQTSSDVTGETLIRLPDNIDAATMLAYSADGLGSLDIDQLAPVLKTAWFFSTSRDKETAIRLKYADFVSATTDKALKNAIARQGFDGSNSKVLASGTDENGNTYTYGSIVLSGTTYYWRVAACPLSEVYGNEQLPSDSLYVGITVSSVALMNLDTSTVSS